MTIDVFNTKGEKTGKISLPKEIFGIEASPKLLAQAVRVYLANQKKARPKTKTRSQVNGSGRKIWRQKGTGRARHGDRQAPIFVGGGIAHGPEGTRRRLSLSQVMGKKALFSALSGKLRENKLLVVEDLKINPKTREIEKILETLLKKTPRRVLLVIPPKNEVLKRAARNIPWLKVSQFNILNSYEVLDCDQMIFTKEAISQFNILNK